MTSYSCMAVLSVSGQAPLPIFHHYSFIPHESTRATLLCKRADEQGFAAVSLSKVDSNFELSSTSYECNEQTP